jgi:uncharacterized membrane protein YdjX (TVP38/TMEM64 family)
MAKTVAQAAMTDRPESRARKSAFWRFLPIGVMLAGLIFGYAMGWQHYLTLGYLGKSQDVLLAFVAAHPVLSAAGFVIFYALVVAFSFPAAFVLTIFGGFLFGWALGALLSIVGATSGATALFLAARTAFGDRLRKRLGGMTARLAEGFEEDAFVFLLVLRLAPFIPFVVVNVAPAFFNVRLRTFVTATAIGIVPGAFAYAWLGQGVGSVLDAAQAAGRNATAKDLVTPEITFAFAALALVALIAAVVRKLWKHKHSAALKSEQGR